MPVSNVARIALFAIAGTVPLGFGSLAFLRLENTIPHDGHSPNGALSDGCRTCVHFGQARGLDMAFGRPNTTGKGHRSAKRGGKKQLAVFVPLTAQLGRRAKWKRVNPPEPLWMWV